MAGDWIHGSVAMYVHDKIEGVAHVNRAAAAVRI